MKSDDTVSKIEDPLNRQTASEDFSFRDEGSVKTFQGASLPRIGRGIL